MTDIELSIRMHCIGVALISVGRRLHEESPDAHELLTAVVEVLATESERLVALAEETAPVYVHSDELPW